MLLIVTCLEHQLFDSHLHVKILNLYKFTLYLYGIMYIHVQASLVLACTCTLYTAIVSIPSVIFAHFQCIVHTVNNLFLYTLN